LKELHSIAALSSMQRCLEGRTGWKSGKTNEGGGGGISS